MPLQQDIVNTEYLDHKRALQHYPYHYRKFHTNLVRYFYESNQVMRRTWITTGTSRKEAYSPHEVDQAVTILPMDEDKGLAWGSPIDLYVRNTSDLGTIPPHLGPRFNGFITALRESVARHQAQGAKLACIAGDNTILNDTPGAIRLAERAFRWGNREMNVLLLLQQTRVVRAFTGITGIDAEEKAANFFYRDVGGRGEPFFKIISSMVYEWYERLFHSPAKGILTLLIVGAGILFPWNRPAKTGGKVPIPRV